MAARSPRGHRERGPSSVSMVTLQSVTVAAPGPVGIFPSDGVYRWNLLFSAPGTAYLNLTVVDTLGTVDSAMTVVTIAPPLSVNVTSAGRDRRTPFAVREPTVAGGLHRTRTKFNYPMARRPAAPHSARDPSRRP